MVVGVSVAVHPVHLWLNLFPLPIFSHVSSIDLIIEVADITHDCAWLECTKHRRVAHVDVTGCRTKQIGLTEQISVD